jgi:hypothetical protein
MKIGRVPPKSDLTVFIPLICRYATNKIIDVAMAEENMGEAWRNSIGEDSRGLTIMQGRK